MHRTGLLVLLISLAMACGAPRVQSDVPALLVNPGPESLQVINRTVSEALDVPNVTLAQDVFTESSVLIIQRDMQRGIGRPPELGRDLGRPYRFQLIRNGAQCLLVDEQSGRRWPLAGVECVEE